MPGSDSATSFRWSDPIWAKLPRDLIFLFALIGCGLTFYLVPLPLIALLGLAAFTLLAFSRMELALASIIVFVPFFMRQKHLLGRQFPVTEPLLAATLLAALAVAFTVWTGWAGRQSTKLRLPEQVRPTVLPDWAALRKSPFLAPGFLFLMAGGISSILAVQRHLAFREYGEVMIEPAIFFALLVLFRRREDTPRSQGWLFAAGAAIILAGAIPSGMAVIQVITRSGLVSIPGASYSRAPAWYHSADNLGLLLDRALPMAGAVALYVWVRRSHRVPSAIIASMWVLVALMGLALVFTFVLGAWLAVFAVLTLVAGLYLRPSRRLAIAAIIAVIGGLALVTTQGFVGSHGVTSGRRLDIWQSSIHIIRAHPFFGIGPDNFQHYYAPRSQTYIQCAHGLGYMLPAAADEPCLSHPHNEILDLWLSTGLLGLLAFAWMVVTFFVQLRARLRGTAFHPVFVGAGAGLVAGLLHGLVDNSYFLIDLSLLTWFLFAVVSPTATNQTVTDSSIGEVPTHP